MDLQIGDLVWFPHRRKAGGVIVERAEVGTIARFNDAKGVAAVVHEDRLHESLVAVVKLRKVEA